MRVKKVRGHKRIWREIEQWRKNNLELDPENLKQQHRDYTKIWIHPIRTVSTLNSRYPEPKGKTRRLILSGLIDIYDSWKASLDSLSEPYYLKIWLFEPNFSDSQVVCAIRSALDFYDSTFYKPDNISDEKLGNMRSSLPEGFHWDLRLDEYHMSSKEIGEPEDYYSQEDYEAELQWFNKQLRKPHRTTTETDSEGKKVEYYSFKKGFVWLGDRNI
jgi:hypothetical protein